MSASFRIFSMVVPYSCGGGTLGGMASIFCRFRLSLDFVEPMGLGGRPLPRFLLEAIYMYYLSIYTFVYEFLPWGHFFYLQDMSFVGVFKGDCPTYISVWNVYVLYDCFRFPQSVVSPRNDPFDIPRSVSNFLHVGHFFKQKSSINTAKSDKNAHFCDFFAHFVVFFVFLAKISDKVPKCTY